MAKFPQEIWSKVFIQLTLRERLECKLVCREWRLFIDDACLLYRVEIKDSVNMFDVFINILNSSPDRAGYVKELTLDNCLDVEFNKRILCNIFPNVRLLQVLHKENYEYRRQYFPFTASVEMAHLQPALESLTDSFYLELASQILTSNLGGRLHTLVLQDTSGDPNTLLYEIQNLPVLKSLTLSTFAIGIAIMEFIHQKVPSIQELNLQDIDLEGGNMPSTKIIPTSVTSFDISMDYASNLEAHYVTKLGLTHFPADSVHFLKNIPKLTAVSMQTFRSVNFIKFLENFPNTIKEFHVECDNLPFNSVYTSITPLYLHGIEMNSEFGRLISQCCPNLVNLTLFCDTPMYTRPVHNCDHPLQQATVRIHAGNKVGFVFNNRKEIEYYLCDRGVNRVERSSLEGLPCLIVTTRRSFELDISDDAYHCAIIRIKDNNIYCDD